MNERWSPEKSRHVQGQQGDEKTCTSFCKSAKSGGLARRQSWQANMGLDKVAAHMDRTY